MVVEVVEAIQVAVVTQSLTEMVYLKYQVRAKYPEFLETLVSAHQVYSRLQVWLHES